jgi:hypothetical protein
MTAEKRRQMHQSELAQQMHEEAKVSFHMPDICF